MKYKANPVIVDAFEITKIGDVDPRGDRMLVLSDNSKIVADKGMTARYIPTNGDFVVIQADGYHYINPRAVFLKKYSPIENVA